ncbi:MAG: Ig-like domain-containing protein [Bacteroidota bacterium]
MKKYLYICWLPFLWLSACVEEAPFFPADPNTFTVVATEVGSVSLDEGRTGVKVDAEFTLIFSNPVNPDQAAQAVSLSSSNGNVDLTISFNDNQSIMALIPNDSLAFETLYTLNVNTSAVGQQGEALTTSFARNFETEIEPKPLFDGGDGTEANPYLVGTAEQLDIVRLFLESFFIMTSDIDVSGPSAADPAGWLPIGDLNEPFTGNFDGGGFTVKGLTIARTDRNEVGLFGVLGGTGVIQNLNVQATGVAGSQATGALVGRQLSGTIRKCSSSGSVTANNSRVGGLVGSQEAGLITQCMSSCGVFSELSRVGGLVGLTQAGTVEKSSTSGNSESLSSRVGGVVGSVEEGATVTDNYATGNVTARNRGGGLYGRVDGTANRGYATGNITITDADDSGDYAGHAVGQVGGSSSITELYYPTDQTINYGGNADITIEGTPTNIGSFSCGNPIATFSGFDFASVWVCTADGTWPSLQ